ncbi:hypothetical protein GGX14DRAFT_307144, partial [Mycena pura]
RIHLSRGFGSLLAAEPRQSWIANVRYAAHLLEKQNFAISDVDKVLGLTSGLPDTCAPLIIEVTVTP